MSPNRAPDLSFNLPSLDCQTIIFQGVLAVYNFYNVSQKQNGIMHLNDLHCTRVQVSIASRLLRLLLEQLNWNLHKRIQKGTDICRWNVNLSILLETGYFLKFPFFWKNTSNQRGSLFGNAQVRSKLVCLNV